MKDYPELNMFLDRRRLLLLEAGITCPYMVIVSTFDPNASEEDGVRELRGAYLHVPGTQTSCCLAHGEDFGVVVFRPTGHDSFLQTQEYCEKLARKFNQTGYVAWDSESVATFVALDGTKTELQPWDKTIERLEEWCQFLRPGFKVLGQWNRQSSYIQMRHAQLKGTP